MTGRPRRIATTSLPWVELAAAIIDGTPPLRLALCRRAPPQVFDGTSDENRATAIKICRACPALADCRRWVAALPPSRRVSGVVAAKYRGGTRRKEIPNQ